MTNLEQYLQDCECINNLIKDVEVVISEENNERHYIYSLLLMAITCYYWNGNKDGQNNRYPLNPTKEEYPEFKYLDSNYLGHNISAIAVDGDGNVIDFEFNHNEIYNSSVEHAESRLIRRVFSLSQISDTWNIVAKEIDRPIRYGTLLNNVSVYTSLESCSQCAGIMALATLKEVVYLQTDPGMYKIGNILRRLTEGTKLQAPLPIPANSFKFGYFKEIDEAYNLFAEKQAKKEGDPFSISSKGEPRYTQSITSFLCTKAAFDIYLKAHQEFEQLSFEKLKYPKHKQSQTSLTNAQCLEETKRFFNYVQINGFRATTHKQ